VVTKGGAIYRTPSGASSAGRSRTRTIDISKVPEADLPEEFKKLKPEERVALLKKKIAEREAIQKEIARSAPSGPR